MSNKLTLSASDRISSLLDEASFVEVGAYVTARNTDFNMQENDTPKDGVLLDMVSSMENWCMYTARMQPFLVVQSVRCTQRRLRRFMTWL